MSARSHTKEPVTPQIFLRLILVMIFFVSGGLAARETAVAKEQTRVALVVGNETYSEASIPNAVSDAKAVADVLRHGGFDVVYAENAKKADIVDALRAFAVKMERGAVAVVYYAGHALQFQDRNFLVPTHSKLSSQADIRTEGIDMDLLLDPVIVARSPGSVVIIDASRQNPWDSLVPGRPRGLAAQPPLSGICVVYATAPGKVAAGHAFASELVKAMKTPGLGFDAIINRTRVDVMRVSGKEQVVWQSSAPPKDLVILSAGTAAKSSAKAADAVELGFWDTIKNGDTPGDFQIYLDSYPNGQFSAAAQTRLAELQEKKSGPSVMRSAAATGVVTERPSTSGTVTRDCPVCPEIVSIPAGSFEMGAMDGLAFERLVHHVSISKSFFIGRREVTFDEWDACADEGGCQYRPADRGLGRGLRPVTDIDWNDAKSYLSWLSAKTGRAYRLPTEAEWEYAARAGSQTTYPWGNVFEKDRANCVGCTTIALGKAVETGTFPANGFGLFDMAGNAAEWVEDCWNETYNKAPTDGSAWNKSDCRERVLRGGSFNNDTRFLRSASRFKYDYNVRYYTNGFRVVRE
jgi:formylglycine-generating enzyme required for sulfatase activity